MAFDVPILSPISPILWINEELRYPSILTCSLGCKFCIFLSAIFWIIKEPRYISIVWYAVWGSNSASFVQGQVGSGNNRWIVGSAPMKFDLDLCIYGMRKVLPRGKFLNINTNMMVINIQALWNCIICISCNIHYIDWGSDVDFFYMKLKKFVSISRSEC